MFVSKKVRSDRRTLPISTIPEVATIKATVAVATAVIFNATAVVATAVIFNTIRNVGWGKGKSFLEK
jgi:hypothetical protein